MIEMEMSKDIRDFEPKIIGPLTTRQLIFVAVGASIALPVALYIPLPIEYKIMIALLIAAPFVIFGFVKLYGMGADVFILKVFYPYYIKPRKRRYKSENKDENTNEYTLDYLMPKTEEPKKKKKIHYVRKYAPRK